MGKKLRYILLSFSVVLAIFVFALLWQVRPDFDSSVLDDARERQNAQLVNVNQPLETSTSARADEEALITEVVARVEDDEAFISSISSSVEGEVKAYVDSLVEDPAIAEALSRSVLDIILNDETVQNEIASYVDSVISEKEAEYAEYIASEISRINNVSVSDVAVDVIRNEIDRYVDDNLVYADDIIDRRIDVYVNENLPYANDLIDSRIEKYVDENIGYIESVVADEKEAEEESVPVEESIPVVSSYEDEQEAVAEAEPVRVVSNPVFSFDETSSLGSQSREDVRNNAIRSILDSLVD